MDDLRLESRPDEEETGDGEKRGVWGLAAALLGVLAAGAALYYFVFMKKPDRTAAETAAVSELAAPPAETAAPAVPGGEALAFPPVGLGASDAAVREFAAVLSADPEFARWLLSKDLVRTFVVSVDNVANGLSPKSHIGFFAPEGGFRVTRTRTGTLVDPASYARYEPVAAVVRSLDAVAAARLYRAVKPLLQEAYAELGYPGVDFDDTLVRAMGEVLGAPVVDGPVLLEQKVLSYAMTDPSLEALSPAQKQVLRLGPKGVAAVHAKIRELAAALGIAPARLPKPAAYATAAK
ncbi:MAG: DUF3014 domain-containing protein [Candidatus Aminicenantes bacterium]|nr:DUF3014 domain-containing protein [Candidatus Aminicenantes bacterium]NLH78035.1 DUF3014 domain-containing protein [Acidobacteriota bacterium]